MPSGMVTPQLPDESMGYGEEGTSSSTFRSCVAWQISSGVVVGEYSLDYPTYPYDNKVSLQSLPLHDPVASFPFCASKAFMASRT